MNNIIVAFRSSQGKELGLLVFKNIDENFFDFLVENKDIQEIKDSKLWGFLKDPSELISVFHMDLLLGCSHIVKSINQIYSCLLFVEVLVLDTPMGNTLTSILDSFVETTETSNLPLSICLSGTSSKLECFNFTFNNTTK